MPLAPTAASPLPEAVKTSWRSRSVSGSAAIRRPPFGRRKSAALSIARPAALAWTIWAVCVDEEQAGAKAIESVGEGRRFRLLKVNQPVDQHGAAHVRHDKPHPPARFLVDQAVLPVTEDAEH